MPNIIAFAVLLSWPLVAARLFQSLPLERAVILGIVVPFMVLPSATGINLPAIPDLNKTTLPNIVLLLLAVSYAGRAFSLMPRSGLGKVLVALMLASPFMTAVTNSDPLLFPAGYIPGLSLYDALSNVVYSLMIFAPFLVGRQCLASSDAHRVLVKILAVAGLIYSVPMLFEIRMSPQLHNWIYGFHPSSFVQQMRGGGFRPMVLMNHGLIVAFFTLFALVSAAALWRAGRQDMLLRRESWGIRLVYLFVLLVLCKSLGSLVYAVFLVGLIAMTGVRIQIYVAALLVLTVLLYPMLRGVGAVPLEGLLDLARMYSEDRAGSLNFRFEQEASLLDRAELRPVFGWGSWGRYHIHDPITGAETSTVDGYWIIAIGSLGWIGFITTFGLLALPVLGVLGKMNREGIEGIRPETAALCLLLAINMVDLLPNAALLPLTWLIAGSLLGYAERAPETAPKADRDTTPTPSRPRTIL